MTESLILKVGDTVQFRESDHNQYIKSGMLATVHSLCADGDYFIQGKDADGDEGEWYVLPDGTVRDAEHVTVRFHARQKKAASVFRVGMAVICHGRYDDSEDGEEGELNGVTAKVVRELSEGFVIEITDDDCDLCAETFDVNFNGLGEYCHVTPVTESSVGVILREGDTVQIRTTTVNDNFGVSIDGLLSKVHRVDDGAGPQGTVFWIDFVVSDGSTDGYFADEVGSALDFGDLHCVPLVRTMSDAQYKAAIEKAKMAEQRLAPTPNPMQDLINERAERCNAVPPMTMAFGTNEYGHRDSSGEVHPWHKDLGPFPHKAVEINGEKCRPVKREVHYFEWEDL